MKMSLLNVLKLSIGGLLLLPSLLSVLAFVIQFLFEENMLIHFVDDRGIWTGGVDYDNDGGGGGYMSALPVYFGLMALSGGYLIGTIKEN